MSRATWLAYGLAVFGPPHGQEFPSLARKPPLLAATHCRVHAAILPSVEGSLTAAVYASPRQNRLFGTYVVSQRFLFFDAVGGTENRTTALPAKRLRLHTHADGATLLFHHTQFNHETKQHTSSTTLYIHIVGGVSAQ